MRGLGSIATGWLIAALVCSGCAKADPTNQPVLFPIAFQNFVAAQPLRVVTAGTQVFRDQASWDAFWAANASGAGAAPLLDFNDEMLIGVFYGTFPAGCQSFVDAIVRVDARVDGLNTFGVVQVEIGALPALGNCQTPVFPFQVIAIQATIASVEFVGQLP